MTDYRLELREAIHLLSEAWPLLRDHALCNGMTYNNPNQILQRIIEFQERYPFIDCDDEPVTTDQPSPDP